MFTCYSESRGSYPMSASLGCGRVPGYNGHVKRFLQSLHKRREQGEVELQDRYRYD